MTSMCHLIWLLAAAAIFPASYGYPGSVLLVPKAIVAQSDDAGTAASGGVAGRQLVQKPSIPGAGRVAGGAVADVTRPAGARITHVNQVTRTPSGGSSSAGAIGQDWRANLPGLSDYLAGRGPSPFSSWNKPSKSTPSAPQSPLTQAPKAPGPQPATPGQPKPPAVPTAAGGAPAAQKQQQMARVRKYWDDFNAGMKRFIETKVESYSEDITKMAVKAGSKKAFNVGRDCGECIAICAHQKGHMDAQWCWNILQSGSIKDAFKCPCKLYYGKPKANPSAAPQLITPKDLGTL